MRAAAAANAAAGISQVRVRTASRELVSVNRSVERSGSSPTGWDDDEDGRQRGASLGNKQARAKVQPKMMVARSKGNGKRRRKGKAKSRRVVLSPVTRAVPQVLTPATWQPPDPVREVGRSKKLSMSRSVGTLELEGRARRRKLGSSFLHPRFFAYPKDGKEVRWCPRCALACPAHSFIPLTLKAAAAAAAPAPAAAAAPAAAPAKVQG